MFSWVILKEMKNEGEKSGEKIMFLIVLLRMEKGRDFGGVHKFSLSPSSNYKLSTFHFSSITGFLFLFLFFVFSVFGFVRTCWVLLLFLLFLVIFIFIIFLRKHLWMIS